MDAVVREGCVAFGDWETWFRIVGDVRDRAPLLCLHGGPGSSHVYFTLLERLAPERSVVLYDQVGCGRSARPPVEELSVDVFVAEVANLRERLELDEAFILGTSWGGMLAIEYALTQPAGLRGVILNSTLASVDTWAREAARLCSEMPEPHRSVLLANDVDDPRYGQAQAEFDRRHICRVDSPLLDRMEQARSPEVYRAMWGRNEWTVEGKLAGWDVRERLHEIRVPALITAGRHDLCTQASLDELRAGLPHAGFVILENSAHMPSLEEPERYRQILRSFMDEHDPR